MAVGMTDRRDGRHVGLFFSNFQGGGIQRVRLNLAEALLARGWRVDLVLVQASGPLKSEIPAGCRLFDLQAAHASQSLFKFARYLKTEKPAVVISAQTHLNLTAILARILSGWRGRLLVGEHITLDYSTQNSTLWKERLFPLLAAIFYRLADKIIVVSKGSARHLINATHLPEALIKVIYNPIISEKLITQSHSLPDHPWLAVPGLPVILSAGRLVPQKDFMTLLRAFSLVKARIPTAKLIILGDGPEQPHLELLAGELGLQDSVRFPGFVLNPHAYMAHAALFVLSSRWEGFGNVIAEALACGTPVVSTDCPSGPAEILADGIYGRLAPVGNPEALAVAMLLELSSPHDSELLQHRAAEFSIDHILPEYIQILQPGGGNPP